MQPRSINEILQNTIPDFFELSPPDKQVLSIEARNREIPKICEMIELDPLTLKPIGSKAA